MEGGENDSPEEKVAVRKTVLEPLFELTLCLSHDLVLHRRNMASEFIVDTMYGLTISQLDLCV